MARVEVEILGHFAGLAGGSKATVEIDTLTVGGLLAEIQRSWNKGFFEAIWDIEGQQPSHSVVILANDKPIYHQNGLETRLVDGDTVTFIPPMAGGNHRGRSQPWVI